MEGRKDGPALTLGAVLAVIMMLVALFAVGLMIAAGMPHA